MSPSPFSDDNDDLEGLFPEDEDLNGLFPTPANQVEITSAQAAQEDEEIENDSLVVDDSDDLGDLFGGPTPPPAPLVVSEEEEDAGLEDLFGESPSEDLQEDITTSTPPSVETDDVTSETATTEDVAVIEPTATLPTEKLTGTEPKPVAPEPDKPARRGPPPRSPRSNLDQFLNTSPKEVIPSPAEEISTSIWTPPAGLISSMPVDVLNRLQSVLPNVTGFISSEPSVTHLINTLILTRKTEIDQKQRDDFDKVLGPFMENIVHAAGRDVTIASLVDLMYDQFLNLGPLGILWRDPRVTEIMVNSPDYIAVEMNGKLYETGIKFPSLEFAQRTARAIARVVEARAVDRTNNIVDAPLPEGARVHITYAPVVESGISINIRKPAPLLSLGRLKELDAVTDEEIEFISAVIKARATILVSGGTGSGKTTNLNAFSELLPPNERVITVEDTRELNIKVRNWLPHQSKGKSTTDDNVLVTLGDLLRSCLRERPDRIIVGEVRDGDAANAMLEAATTGHDGTMTTIHANSANDALRMFHVRCMQTSNGSPAAVESLIMDAFDVVIHVERDDRSGLRYVKEIGIVDPIKYTETGKMGVTLIFQNEVIEDASTDSGFRVIHKRAESLPAGNRLIKRMRRIGADVDKWTKSS